MLSKNSLLKTIEKLTSAVAPSGFENEVKNIVVSELKPYADNLWIDTFGNVIAVKKGVRGGGKIMLVAHMDEMSFVITDIDENGFIRFATTNDWNRNILLGQRVIILTKDFKKIRGVIGYRSSCSERNEYGEVKDIFIDIGASNAKEVKELGIEPGCMAILDNELIKLTNDIISSRALDDRAGLAIMIEIFKNIDNVELDIYAVATVQEKMGLKGSKIASSSISPQIAIVLDTTRATDVSEKENIQRIQLGKGAVIKVFGKERNGVFITHQAIKELLVTIAEEEEIPYQVEIGIENVIDIPIIDLSKEGVLVSVVSIPVRYFNSSIEIANLNDIVSASKISIASIRKITSEWIEKYLVRKLVD